MTVLSSFKPVIQDCPKSKQYCHYISQLLDSPCLWPTGYTLVASVYCRPLRLCPCALHKLSHLCIPIDHSHLSNNYNIYTYTIPESLVHNDELCAKTLGNMNPVTIMLCVIE